MYYQLSLILFFLLFETIASICPPTGPVLPAPNIPHDLPLDSLTKILDDFVHNSAEYGWNSTTNSFSVMATSPNHTFFRHHYTAPLRNDSGVDEVGDDTVYMVASVTKIFTVLAVWLEEKMNLDDPIGKYVKELNISGWGDVTLRLLTNQLAALPRWGMLIICISKKGHKIGLLICLFRICIRSSTIFRRFNTFRFPAVVAVGRTRMWNRNFGGNV